MIEYRRGDLFADDAEALVNPVNCLGVMGAGLALTFHERLPEACVDYRRACRNGEVRPGHLVVEKGGGRIVIHFPTKRGWWDRSQLDDIEAGLMVLPAVLDEHGCRSVAIPALGCGLGGLAWADVQALVDRHLAGIAGVRITVYAPRQP